MATKSVEYIDKISLLGELDSAYDLVEGIYPQKVMYDQLIICSLPWCYRKI